jgi:hypothetical protein
MLENKDYCDYETSVALYELGYDCQVIHLIAEKITLYEAQKWLREVKGIHITINYIRLEEDIFMYTLRHIGKKLRENGGLYNNEQYSSYEKALSEGIKETIKILRDERID